VPTELMEVLEEVVNNRNAVSQVGVQVTKT